MCVVHEFSDAEIISKNKNRFPNCHENFPAGARIVFMTRMSACYRVAKNKISVKLCVQG
jgi:hypothetical protein